MEGRAVTNETGSQAGGASARTKVVMLSLLSGVMLFSFAIRQILGVVAPKLREIYGLKPEELGNLLASWNLAYTAALSIAGPLIDRFGPWICMAVGSGLWGLATMSLPLASSSAGLMLMRVAFGFGQGPLIPCTSTSISGTFPAKDRARAVSVAFTGNSVGLFIGAPIAGMIYHLWGWEWVFYIWGGASLLLTLLWVLLYPEKVVGRVKSFSSSVGNETRPPWLSLFSYRSTWGIAFGQLGYLYAYYFFVTWLPTYLVDERKMTILKSGFVSALPFLAGVVGTLAGGWIADRMIANGRSSTFTRKSIIGGGLIGSTVMVIAAAYTENVWLAVGFITLCVGSLRLATASCNALPIDLAPRNVLGSVTAIQNFFGNIGGTLAPLLTGYLIKYSGSFVSSLVAAGGMAALGAFSYVLIVGDLHKDRIAPEAARDIGSSVPSPQAAS